MKRKSGISIIICCYNSALRIAETLTNIFAVHIPTNFNCELIIIDNNSTDETKLVALDAFEKYCQKDIDFRIIDENTPGLTSARKKGIQKAKYQLILFCDDDNHLHKDYIMVAKEIFDQDLSIGIAGGWCKPKLPYNPGKWIEDFYPALAIGKQGQRNGYVDCVFGAGMIIRYDVFEKLDTRKITLMLCDRVGTKQTSGGDTEICAAARFIGYKIYYSEQLILHHQISTHRLSWQSFLKANFRNVFPLVYLHLMQTLIKDHSESINRIYGRSLRRSVSMVLHFLPRVLFGRHRFYSFMMIYQNLQLLLWLLTRKEHFKYTAYGIKKNLYNGEK